MPRLIFKCPYIKGGAKRAAHLKNYVGYIATREGVELIKDSENVQLKGKYVSYMANRPHSHGLFSGSDKPLVLSQIVKEVSEHPGNVWMPIISLKREDAARLGYDSVESWKALLNSYTMEMARHMKIPWEQFRWYAAFHDEKDHPHVHMVCYSKDPSKGFLSKQGIAKIKSDLAGRIFRQELTEIYSRQTQRRDGVAMATKEKLEKLIRQMQMGAFQNDRIAPLMEQLSRQLKETTGKKQYGYFKAPLKKLVDEIVDELEKEPCVSQAYSLWYDLREEVLKTYKDDMPPRLPLSQQKEFRRIKNIVVHQAVKLGEPHFENTDVDMLKLASGVTHLLRQVGNLFQEQMPPLPPEMAQTLVDHKLRRKIQEKKEALGHKME